MRHEPVPSYSPDRRRGHAPWSPRWNDTAVRFRISCIHELLDQTFSRMRGALFALRAVRSQLLDAGECAARMAELVGAPPAGRVADIGGPEVRAMNDLADAYRAARAWRRPVVSVPIAGRIARALKTGANLAPDHASGTTTWEQWLKTQYGD